MRRTCGDNDEVLYRYGVSLLLNTTESVGSGDHVRFDMDRSGHHFAPILCQDSFNGKKDYRLLRNCTFGQKDASGIDSQHNSDLNVMLRLPSATA